MTWYELWLFLHVVAAAVWVGGATMIQAFALRVLGDAARTAVFAKDVELIGMRLLTPASLLLFATGIALVVDGSWDWSEPFVLAGLIVGIGSFAAGAGFLGPESGRISKILLAEGPASVDAQRRIRRILLYSRTELALLVFVVFMMTVKLGT